MCVPGSPLGRAADHPIVLAVGPEVIAGSTRLKAGTAQKLALNAFSTALMVRRGRAYGNLMSSMRVANAKLRERAVRVCCGGAGCDEDAARAALAAASDDLEVALVMLLAGVDVEAARARRPRPGASGRPPDEARRRRRARRRQADAGDVAVEDGVVTALGVGGGGRGIAAPGFVDLQVNGFAGVDFQAADADAYLRAGEALLATGVTAFQPTFITAPEVDLAAALRAMPSDGCGPRISVRTSRGRSCRRGAWAPTTPRAAARRIWRCCAACWTRAL